MACNGDAEVINKEPLVEPQTAEASEKLSGQNRRLFEQIGLGCSVGCHAGARSHPEHEAHSL